jgi:hypothetical protein
LSTVLKLAYTRVPQTEKYPARELPFPHLAGTTGPQERIKIGKYKGKRRKHKADATLEDPKIHTERRNIAQQSHRSHPTEGANDLQVTQG